MIPSFHGMISSFYGMIPSFHAVYCLRQRDKSAKVIDYKGQVIRVREYLLFRGIPSPMFFQLSRKRQCTAIMPNRSLAFDDSHLDYYEYIIAINLIAGESQSVADLVSVNRYSSISRLKLQYQIT